MLVTVACTPLFLAMPVRALAATYYVQESTNYLFGGIQGSIDAAANGDTILVGPGTYRENLDLLGKRITLKSERGPHVTIIDGSSKSPRSVIRATSGETNETIVEGFTLTGGTGEFDGGASNGGGLYIFNSFLTLLNNVVSGNHVSGFGADGGGLFYWNVKGGALIVRNNTFSENSAYILGGGMRIAGDAEVFENRFEGNWTEDGDGGGLFCNGGNLILVGNYLYGNVAEDRGGGFCLVFPHERAGSAEVRGNIFLGNTASTNVGSDCAGGALHIHGGSVRVIGNTFAYNHAEAALTFGAGGLCVDKTVLRLPIVIERNIFAHNKEGGYYCSRCISMPEVSQNLFFENGLSDVIVNGTNREVSGDNLVADPMFCDLPGPNFGSVAGASPALNQPFGVIGAVETPDCGPFIAVSVEETTWGGIKKLLSR